MANLTLSIPEELKKKMKEHPEMNFSAIARNAIEKKINDLELLDKLTENSNLTEEDVEEIASKINREVYEELSKKFKKREAR